MKPRKLVKRAILLKGPSGCGKSFQFRKLVEGGWKGLYVCVDENMGTVEDLDPDTWFINTFDVPLMPSEKNSETQDFIRLMDFLRSDQHDYDFVYFDSFMAFGDAMLHDLEFNKRFTGFELWGTFGKRMKMALKLLTSLRKATQIKPLHVIATWGVEVDQDWEGKRAIVPVVDGKMVGPRIDFFFDDVLMLRKKPNSDGEVQYVAYTGGTSEFDAKVSSGINKLPAVIAQPDLYRIINKAMGVL